MSRPVSLNGYSGFKIVRPCTAWSYGGFVPNGRDPADLGNPANRPPIPHHHNYIIPRGHPRFYFWENYFADLFRREGHTRMAKEIELIRYDEAANYLTRWLAVNQHIPAVYLVLGTSRFDDNEPDWDPESDDGPPQPGPDPNIPPEDY